MEVNVRKKAPDFLVVGAAKSGTTSLWYYLNQHPAIFLNKNPKELGYFSDYYGIKDFDEYLKHFDNAGKNQIIGEVCHSYLSSPESPKRIYDFNPKMKIIIILRNPIDRAYSLYNWMIQEGFERTNSFETALKVENKRIKDHSFKNKPFYFRNYLYASSGLYYEQVKLFFEIYPKDNIKVYLFEDFSKKPSLILNDIFKFLEVSPCESINLNPQNVSTTVRVPLLNYILKYHYFRLCDNFFIPRKLASSFAKAIDRFNKKGGKVPKMKSSTRRSLRDYYKDDIKKLSLLLNKDLRLWLEK